MIGSAPMSTYTDNALALVARILGETEQPATERLRRILRVSAMHRSQIIANTLRHDGGDTVRAGPFRGMRISSVAAEGCSLPKLLGCYERELHLAIELIVARGYGHVLNVGCAEGYYAVGLARRMPNTVVHAHDIEESCRTACAALAERNGVDARVTVGGEIGHADFARFPAGDTVVIADIEGAELSLLDPASAPALRGFDLLVELHNDFETPTYQAFLDRFETTHEIERIAHGGRDHSVFPELDGLENMDQLLAGWEWRRGPNPWAWMRVRG